MQNWPYLQLPQIAYNITILLYTRYLMENSQLVLGYWDIRGLAQRLRQLLEYCGLPYSEAKYVGPEDRTRWNEEVKPKLILKNPAVTLPYLQDGDKVISESDAISLYICFKANKPELTGRDPEEKVAMATAWGVFKDIHIQFVGLCYGMHGLPSWETAVAEYPKRFRSYLQKFKGLLGEKEFMAGNLTFVDFGIAEFFQALSLLFPQLLAEFPTLGEYQTRVWSLPELSAYFSSERFHERPINNYAAVWK